MDKIVVNEAVIQQFNRHLRAFEVQMSVSLEI